MRGYVDTAKSAYTVRLTEYRWRDEALADQRLTFAGTNTSGSRPPIDAETVIKGGLSIDTYINKLWLTTVSPDLRSSGLIP